MSRNYKFHNPEGDYFASFAVVEWLDVFTHNENKDLLLESLEFCQRAKGMEVFATNTLRAHPPHPRSIGVEKKATHICIGILF